MINQELSQIFSQMADFLEMGEVDFRSRAYHKAARFLESLEKDIEDIYKEGGIKMLEDLPSIGESLAKKIEEFIKTGRIKSYQKFKKQCPVDLESLKKVEGLASKKIKVLYKKLGVRNLKDLENAAKQGKIRSIEGFGEKSEKNILESINFAQTSQGRILLGLALPLAQEITTRLKKLPQVGRVSSAGSLRRMKETIGDIDILITSSKPKPVMDFFVKMSEVARVWAKGPTKSSIHLKAGIDCDLRVVKKESFGSALQYFTGSKDHNITSRRLAKKKGLKLNEYGVFTKKGKRIAGKTEKEVYKAIGLSYIEPEIRTNTGEIEASLRQIQGRINGLPKLVGYTSIKGDCHVHSNWSDGMDTIEQMAQAAEKMGYEYLVITDHTKDLKVSNGLNEDQLLRQMKEIDKINSRLVKLKILKGCEVNIRIDGSLDIKDEVLSQLDVVVAGIHSGFKMSEKEMTKRLLQVMENPQIDIISHPTGRLILQRSAYAFDFDEILKTAKKTKTALEINAHPARLDLSDILIRKVVEVGVKLVINTDAHSRRGLAVMEFGIAQARRGWVEKKDILNTKSLKDFLKYFI